MIAVRPSSSRRRLVAAAAATILFLLGTVGTTYGWTSNSSSAAAAAGNNKKHSIYYNCNQHHSSNNNNKPRFLSSRLWGKKGLVSVDDEKKKKGRLIDVSLPKPMGLILEEKENPSSNDSDNDNNDVGRTGGVIIVDILVEGNTATVCRKTGTFFLDLCIGDQVVAVEGTSCVDCSLDQIMDTIADAPNPVHLTLQRCPMDAVAVRFLQSGIAVSATAGTPVCNVAVDAHAPISYSCRNGVCGTCEQTVVHVSPAAATKKKDDNDADAVADVSPKSVAVRQYLRPCVGRVPRGIESITLTPSGRFAV